MRAFATLLLLCGAGCQLTETYVDLDEVLLAVPNPTPDEVDSSVLVIGDVGNAIDDQGRHLLEVLTREVRRYNAGQTLVVFLGDNIYPAGLREEHGTLNAEDRARLSVQIEAVERSGGSAIFVPGNHDYGAAGSEGILRQEAYVNRRGRRENGDRFARFLPATAGPGPAFVDWGQQLRLVLLDTQWWLEEPGRLVGSTTPVNDQVARERVITASTETMRAAGSRHVVVAGHHPLKSTGPHGGFFPWDRHLFPLREKWIHAWAPIPLIGTFYVLARNLGISDTDLSGRDYRRVCGQLEEAFRAVPGAPLVYVAGHEHSLQVLKGPADSVLVVSGAGSPAEGTAVSVSEDTLIASPYHGFFRLDFLRDGRVRLELIEASDPEQARSGAAVWLQREGPNAGRGTVRYSAKVRTVDNPGSGECEALS